MTPAQSTEAGPELRVLQDLTPWKRNYNQGDVDAIARSIDRFGFNGVLRTWDDIVIAGNHAMKALLRRQENDLPPPDGRGLEVNEDGEWMVWTLPTNHLAFREAEAFAIADNHTRDLAQQDQAQLLELLQTISGDDDPTLLGGTGYNENDVAQLLALVSPEHMGTEYDESIADDVEFLECPECGHRWAK